MTRSLVIDNIGLLVTNDSRLGVGPLGVVRNARIVIVGTEVVAVERLSSVNPTPAITDDRIDAYGQCVIPGFVDSHSHLVFAGDRSDEFVARMAGQPYAAGGIRTSVQATRNASNAELLLATQVRRAEAFRAGITTMEIKSGYGLNVVDEARCLQVVQNFTDESTFLGAHVVPEEYEGRADQYVDLVCGEMLSAAAPTSQNASIHLA